MLPAIRGTLYVHASPELDDGDPVTVSRLPFVIEAIGYDVPARMIEKVDVSELNDCPVSLVTVEPLTEAVPE